MAKYIYVKGKQIFDQEDNELLLRGVGLGGWMLPEGYMWGSHGYYNRPRRFEELISYYMEEEASKWWDTYYQTWISDQDFELIKKHGYNSIRLPMNYRLLMEENDMDETVVFHEYGFNMIDYIIEQCKKNNLYLILDLHGAPGGQTGANIDDSKEDYPHLYENEIYQSQLITLWEEIAKRYKDEEIIAMYDLLNEPIPAKFNHLNKYLEPLHEKIIKAIRKIDTNHAICIEGENWASEVKTITRKLDDNIILHFHKYWNEPTVETIQRFLDKQEELDMPLYMGEGGENDLYWYSANFKLYQQHNIGWNFWAYKKRKNHNSVISFNLPEGWHSILDKDNRLSKEEGKRLLTIFLENIKFEHCTVNQDVTNALFQKDDFFTTGGSYDFFGKGISFNTTEVYEDSLRKSDKTFICDRDGNHFQGAWGCHNQEQISQELFPFLKGNPGDFYNYTFYVSDARDQKTITISHVNLDADFYINGEIIDALEDNQEIILQFQTKNEKNILTIEPLNNGIIKVITLK